MPPDLPDLWRWRLLPSGVEVTVADQDGRCRDATGRERSADDFSWLHASGLNLQAVFEVAGLPEAIQQSLVGFGNYRQLILIGHGGRLFWERVKAAGLSSSDPIDDFTRAVVTTWVADQLPDCAHALIYPGDLGVDLQTLGQLAGWHHESPFRVGVNAEWGSWFAYRALLLADSALSATPVPGGASPCASCLARPCVQACPANALDSPTFSLHKCVVYRKQRDSLCRVTCLARTSCPVRPEHRYDDAQIAHSYSRSLAMIEHKGDWPMHRFP